MVLLFSFDKEVDNLTLISRSNIFTEQGPSMMDFFVRESRAIVDGPMAIVRYVLVL